MVLNTDKNLGPAVMERDKYLHLAFRDHLSDKNTYRELSDEEAKARLSWIQSSIETFASKHLDSSDATYLNMRLYTEQGPSFMYLLAKIHKTPLKTRAIISYSGSVCHGIAKWLDVQLQKIASKMPYVAKSSADVVTELTGKSWNRQSQLFTMDAVSMYTNIHVGHALPTLKEFFTTTPLGINILQSTHISLTALLAAIELVMENNVFQFGDTFWLQTAGTAMGTPPAPTYATIYYAIWEYSIIPQFPEIEYYCRYIDDGFGIWNGSNPQRWQEFQALTNAFGATHPFFTDSGLKPLVWEFEDLSTETIFLDLRIDLNNGVINTTIYEKPMNLHLYIPPHSCHAPGVLKGLIYGCINRAHRLCMREEDRMPFIYKTFDRLVRRGHDPSRLLPLFNTALKERKQGTKRLKKSTNTTLRPLFLHLPFNPADPKPKRLQQAFRSNIIQPPDDDHILSLDTMNSFAGGPDFDSLIICYHGQPNLAATLAPRKLRLGSFSVKQHLATL